MAQYRANGTLFPLQPTSGRWLPRKAYGVSGDGHPLYPPRRSFELRWQLMSADDFNTFLGYYEAQGVTGTVVTSLPQWSETYQFFAYSGTVWQEPEVGTYFQEHVEDVILVVTNIRT